MDGGIGTPSQAILLLLCLLGESRGPKESSDKHTDEACPAIVVPWPSGV